MHQRPIGVRLFSLQFITTGILALALSPDALGQAGGLTLPEQGGPISGTAQAGQAAIARDASTSWLNPAGMTRLEGTQMLFGLQPFQIRLAFDSGPFTTTSGGDGGDAGDWFVGGSFYLAHKIDDSTSVGFSVTAPYGLGIEYNDGWVGRYYTTEAEMITINLQPSFAIRVNEQFSFGVGIDIQYADFTQELDINLSPLADGHARIDADNWEIGATIGFLYEPTETTRFGLRYRAEMNHDLEGDLTTFTTLKTTAGLTIPQSLTLSGYHEIDEQWAVMADAGWTDWSRFNRTKIAIDGPAGIEADIPRNWKDTWSGALGLHYRPADRWLLMLGVNYVSSSTDKDDRTPDIPVDRQWRYSAGVEYELNSKWRIGLTYTYVDFGSNKIDNTLNSRSGRLQGNYGTAEAHFIGLYGSVEF